MLRHQAELFTLHHSLEEAVADGCPRARVLSRRHDEQQRAPDDGWELEVCLCPAPARLVALAGLHGEWLDWLEAA